MALNKTQQSDTLQVEARMYAVQVDADTIVSVEATSADEAA